MAGGVVLSGYGGHCGCVAASDLGARCREGVWVVDTHLCEGGVAPLKLMGTETDVVKLRRSRELMQYCLGRTLR